MIAQIVVFSRKTDAQRKKNFAFRSAKIAKVLRMDTLILPNIFQSLTQKTLGITEKKININ